MAQQHQVHNEKIKLSATYLNGIAIALFAVGGLGPWLAVLYGTVQSGLLIFVVSTVYILASFALHFLGRSFLRRLK